MARYDVSGRTAFITGAARGIGNGVARRLHAQGANVALVGMEPDLLEELAADLGGDRTSVYEVDVTDAGALERAATEVVGRFGGIDVGLANAGIAFVGALATAPVEHVERTLEVNLLGVWRTDRAIVRHVMDRQGYLLNVASLAAVSHMPLMGAYTASKAGTEALTDALRAELRPTGARVGCAYFGFIDTDLVRGSLANPAAAAAHALTPGFLGRSAPLSSAVDAIDKGIARRSARVWAPRFVGPALVARGVLQPVVELAMRLRSGTLRDAIDLSATEDSLGTHDAKLGASAREGDPRIARR